MKKTLTLILTLVLLVSVVSFATAGEETIFTAEAMVG